MIGHGQLTFISEVVKYSIPILIAESEFGKMEDLREPEMLSGMLDTIQLQKHMAASPFRTYTPE